MEILSIPLLLLVGTLLSLQAGANVQLASATASPFGASALQLGLGAVLLLALARRLGTLGSLDAVDDVRPGTCSAGSARAVYITAGILLSRARRDRVRRAVRRGPDARVAGCSTPPAGSAWPRRSTSPAIARRPRDAAGIALIVTAQRPSHPPPAAGSRSALVAGPRSRFRARSTPNCAPTSTRRSPWALELRHRGRRRCCSCSPSRAPRARGCAAPAGPVVGLARGLCGATYVTSVFPLIPEIGVAPTIGLTIAGQQTRLRVRRPLRAAPAPAAVDLERPSDWSRGPARRRGRDPVHVARPV